MSIVNSFPLKAEQNQIMENLIIKEVLEFGTTGYKSNNRP
jgi:hypothetical protein